LFSPRSPVLLLLIYIYFLIIMLISVILFCKPLSLNIKYGYIILTFFFCVFITVFLISYIITGYIFIYIFVSGTVAFNHFEYFFK